ncbi:hypothetical protein JW711_00505 [Candidatus Woesearchaeota archaeon]|nr:hypothetical protein [Candidatus Woesearchaeota archaeon]
MIIDTRVDKGMAKSLAKMADITMERLKTTDKEKYPANTLTDYYDALHKLMEAIALLHGKKTKGEGAHQELIDYIAKTSKLDEQIRQLLQQMREYRNRIHYEGFNINKNYIQLNESKITETILKLKEAITSQLK